MIYSDFKMGTFVERPNRFVAKVIIDGKEELVHVKNTGRCKELLIPGVRVYLEDFVNKMGSRKMRYSLYGVEKEVAGGKILVNMDSQAPNKVVREALENGKIKIPSIGKLEVIKGEFSHGDSRLDFYLRDTKGKEALIEVKGVTLEDGGILRFPDAPTLRGVKHINHLAGESKNGWICVIIFVVQMDYGRYFEPNDDTHREFGDALRKAKKAGVEILAYNCHVGANSLSINEKVDVRLGGC